MNQRDARGLRIVALVALAGAGLVLASLLVVATDNRTVHERHFPWLLGVNLAIAGVLATVVVLAGLRLVSRFWHGRFGSRLLLRLAAIFALVGVVPGALVYAVSYQFVSRSIESWFDVSVERALEAGLDLGRVTLDAALKDLSDKTRQAADRLADAPERRQPLALERLREQLAAQEIALLGPGGQVLASAGGSAYALGPERPGTALFRKAREMRIAAQLEGLDDEGLGEPGSRREDGSPRNPPRIRALAQLPAGGFALAGEERWLLVTQWLPPQLAANALAVQSAYREYQERALAREGLRSMYIGTLTLTLVLAVFAAVLLAVTFGNRLAKPLLLLAEGVQQVARGNLGPKPVFSSRDELGGLTRSFAEMTRQLADARGQAEASTAALDGERGKLQTILDTMSAGVVVFDTQGRIDTVNPGAIRILRAPLGAYQHRRLDELPTLAALAAAVEDRFRSAQQTGEPGERLQWQDAFELSPAGGAETHPDDSTQPTVLVRGATLPDGARLIVFDDITELVSAQRAQAWTEVARRLAHEIKNPLTPIQLSAERLEHKLGPKLAENDAAMLARSVATIVTQVQAMKQLVNEFRDYARLPAARLAPLDLNVLVQDVLQLYAEAQEQGRLRARLQADLPPIEGDPSQLRQVVHNLVQNALDAVSEQADGLVEIRSEGRRDAEGRWQGLRLAVEDNGPGFAEGVLQRAFEPYVTTKAKGTGLGLAVVKKICDEHGARIRLGPRDPDGASPRPGARVSISFSKWVA